MRQAFDKCAHYNLAYLVQTVFRQQRCEALFGGLGRCGRLRGRYCGVRLWLLVLSDRLEASGRTSPSETVSRTGTQGRGSKARQNAAEGSLRGWPAPSRETAL